MSDTYRAQLVHTLRKVLKPLVRILFRAGVRFDEFIELLRGIYVEIVIADGLSAAKRVSTSRISILSGVAKKDVERLVSSDEWLKIPLQTDAQALAAILHRWHTDAAFLGPYGVPLELPYSGSGSRNFLELVAGSPIPMDPQSAFEQLLNAGMIARSGDTHVKVLSRSYVVPEPLSAEMLEYFGTAMTNLASTLQYNMDAKSSPKRIERSVFPDGGLPEECMGEFEAYVRDRTYAMLSDIDDWLAALARRPIKRPEVRIPTGVSVFQYVAPGDAAIDLERHVIRVDSQT